MVYSFRPLEMKMDFENRQYKLGDTIDVTIDITPNLDVDVRGATVDLMCQERFVQISAPESAGYSAYGTPTQIHSATIQTQKESNDTYVHSNTVFLGNTILKHKIPITHLARVEINQVQPKHINESRSLTYDAYSSWSFKWTLIVHVDVVRGRNPKRQRVVDINLD